MFSVWCFSSNPDLKYSAALKQKHIHTPRAVHEQSLFIYLLEESHHWVTHHTRPGLVGHRRPLQGRDPKMLNAQSLEESPRLSRAPNCKCVHSASRSVETFCFYIWVLAQARFVCVVYKKPDRKPQDLFGVPDQLLHTRKTNPLVHYYVWAEASFFTELVLPWHKRERAAGKNFQIPIFMLKYANDKDFNNPVQHSQFTHFKPSHQKQLFRKNTGHKQHPIWALCGT